jgi:hypothetical protein
MLDYRESVAPEEIPETAEYVEKDGTKSEGYPRRVFLLCRRDGWYECLKHFVEGKELFYRSRQEFSSNREGGMDGYESCRKVLSTAIQDCGVDKAIVLAAAALERVTRAGE